MEIANLLLAMYSKLGQERTQQVSRATATCLWSVTNKAYRRQYISNAIKYD